MEAVEALAAVAVPAGAVLDQASKDDFRYYTVPGMLKAEIREFLGTGPLRAGQDYKGLSWCEEKTFETMPDTQWVWIGAGSALSVSFADEQLTLTAGPDSSGGC